MIEDSGNAGSQDLSERGVLFHRCVEREPFGADLMGLEDGTETVVLLLGDRIVLVVVAASASQRRGRERFGRFLDGVEHPNVAIELVPIAAQVAGRGERPFVVRQEFIPREHHRNHAIIAIVAIEAVDNPISPMPDMPHPVTDLVNATTTVPIAIPPNVHPMAAPALPIGRTA